MIVPNSATDRFSCNNDPSEITMNAAYCTVNRFGNDSLGLGVLNRIWTVCDQIKCLIINIFSWLWIQYVHAMDTINFRIESYRSSAALIRLILKSEFLDHASSSLVLFFVTVSA